MPRLTDVFESSITLSEMRLKMAMEIARLKTEVDRYVQLEELAAESGDYVASNTLIKMRLNAASEIARLKKEIEKYQHLGNLAAESDGKAAKEKVIAAPAPNHSSNNKSIFQRNIFKRTSQEPIKSKESEADWVDKQAQKLFRELVVNKSFTA